MLILKRVDIQGFKSFCDRTEMRFHGRGVAAVVGPNGCGKSNLSDAISWVLGEQSAKSLRGTRMEDVIFAGTRDRKPLGMAQVTLTLIDPSGEVHIPGLRVEQVRPAKANGNGQTNGHANGHTNGHANGHANGADAVDAADEGKLEQAIQAVEEAAVKPAEDPAQITLAGHTAGKEREITITRRLFRSGESEYLINGKQARLRDIQELFMGTGLGPESYAIIEQGRIGQILSSKPLDRRAVIEEACGISKFKTKRRLAEAKLAGARQNLERVFDILEEVGRQANSLKRQAAKAKRAEEIGAELQDHLKRALTGRFLLLEREVARVALDLNTATGQYQQLNEQVLAGDLALKQAREQFYQTESELTGARKRLSEFEIEAERTRGQLESQARQIANFEQRLQQGEGEGEQIAERLTALDQERRNLADQLEALQQQAGEARARLEDKNAEREEVTSMLRERERVIENTRQQVVRLLGEASSLRNQLAQIESFVASLERDSARIRKDEETALGDLERLEAARTEFTDKLASRQLELESLTDKRKGVESDLNERRTALTETRRTLEALRHETSNLRARRQSLEEILSHRAYTTESVKRLFTAVEHGQADGLAPAGVLADFIELTDPRFEKATEEFLHEELEYVVVRDFEQAQRGLELLRGDLDGRATFLVEPALHGDASQFSAMPAAEPSIGPETGIVGRLSDGIRFTNGLTHAPAALLPRLARCYLAEDRAAAQRLSTQYPDIYFLLSDGVCYHGHAVSGGRQTGSGPLALKRELREITNVFTQRNEALAAAQAQAESLEGDIQTLTETLELVRAEQQRQEKETLLLDQESRKVGEEFNRASQRLSVSRLELERIVRDQERSQAQRTEKLAVVEQKDTGRSGLEASLEQQRSDVEELKSRASLLSEEHSVLRVELAGLEERRRGIDQAGQRLQQQIFELTRRRNSLGEEMERIAVNRSRLLENNLELDQRAGELTASIEQVRGNVAALAETEARLRADLAQGEEQIAALRAATSQAQDKRGQIELDLVRRQSEMKFLDETCRKDLNIAVSELAAARDTSLPEPDEIAVAEAEDKVSELRRRLEALGAVNPEALNEYNESQQRYDFLNTQRQDLLDSIRDTEKAINEIDTESRKRFTEAFEVINQNFIGMFRTLFGGGMGEMRLTGDGDALEQGIEIVAQPPGKRLQNVLLLSGGEKALTAVSLLMAIFKYQPSPFCILDEVDAPLDEANVGRLANLLKDMAAQTQFIVITHAKKTMEAAEMLYGVTMQEQGVSKLVSVKLQAPPPPPPPNLQPVAPAVVS